MPFYRLKVGIVHVKGSKLPDPCAALIARPGREPVPCSAISEFLCDGRQGDLTCDAPLCPRHAYPVGPNRHLCPRCRDQAQAAQRQLDLFTTLIKEDPCS